MSIDVYYCKEEQDGWQLTSDGEEFATVAEFFNFTHMLGQMIELLKTDDLPDELKEVRDSFNSFIDEDREQYDKSFEGYCEFVQELAVDYASRQSNPEGVKYLDVEPENFQPDVRAFLGRLVLNEEPITPQKVEQFISALGALAGLLKTHQEHYKKEDPDVAAALENAHKKAGMIMQYAEEAAAQDCGFIFHP